MAAVLGLDIGGANLKAAHVNGHALSVPFALWKDPALLPHALRTLIGQMPAADVWAVTTTGELCDCFESKRQGVHVILDAVKEAAGNTPVHVWRNDGCFVDVAVARETALQVAAANWLALATFAGPYATWGASLLIDVGSTTTDIVPLLDGRPIPQERTDPQRLRCHELVYTGVRRTPLCALLGGAGAAELFATTLDVYLVLECLQARPSDRSTADGRPGTKPHAHARLARMLCADLESSTEAERLELAERVVSRQIELIQAAVTEVAARLPTTPLTVLFAGEGEFLAERAVRSLPSLSTSRKVLLSVKLGPEISQAACAYAVAMLAAKE
ncbi:MAG TPA: hydantoinase/oxoprolinase family protein [Gemmataceae bacterium]|nr:hydantoinase/oxoprolinase family protein [Gemmataceae bacterium]